MEEPDTQKAQDEGGGGEKTAAAVPRSRASPLAAMGGLLRLYSFLGAFSAKIEEDYTAIQVCEKPPYGMTL